MKAVMVGVSRRAGMGFTPAGEANATSLRTRPGWGQAAWATDAVVRSLEGSTPVLRVRRRHVLTQVPRAPFCVSTEERLRPMFMLTPDHIRAALARWGDTGHE